MVKKILTALMASAAVAAAALALVAGAVGAYTANRAAAADAALYRLGVDGLGAVSGAEAEYAPVPSRVRDLVAETDPERARAAIEALDRAREAAAARLAELGQIVGGDAEKEGMLGEVEERLSLHWAAVGEARALAAAGRRQEALAHARDAASPPLQAARRLMAGMRGAIRADADGRAKANRASVSKSGATMLACMLAAALLSVLSATCGLAASRRG
jgi:hypothetical protein